MFYDGYHLAGMHLFWWFVWLLFIFWMFASPYSIMGYRMLKYSSMDILKRRLASGEISNDEYHEKKRILELPLTK
ncbi:SHOCT domain-containing protein [Cytophaga aurantiaca]|uniref:SHOCT domain-containing protein n=1 Tax=Cytophaga aurantiaca TaxID=29530 RepID=UPI0003692F60|nr:SHOCT domain-containing protein [Cytophaga aurantiaca]